MGRVHGGRGVAFAESGVGRLSGEELRTHGAGNLKEEASCFEPRENIIAYGPISSGQLRLESLGAGWI